jgi:hypothetical protein
MKYTVAIALFAFLACASAALPAITDLVSGTATSGSLTVQPSYEAAEYDIKYYRFWVPTNVETLELAFAKLLLPPALPSLPTSTLPTFHVVMNGPLESMLTIHAETMVTTLTSLPLPPPLMFSQLTLKELTLLDQVHTSTSLSGDCTQL